MLTLAKKIYLLALIGVIISTLSCSQSYQPDAYDTQGNPIKMSLYQGKWVIVNYWANWCIPCLKELPELNNLYQSSKDKLIVLGVNYDQLSDAQINQFANEYRIQFPLLRTFPIQKYGIQDINSLPITFIFSPKGKLVATLSGPQTANTIMRTIRSKDL